MADRHDIGDASPSASVFKPLATAQSMSYVRDRTKKEDLEEEGMERRSWSSQTSHKSEEEEEDGWMVTPLSRVAGRRHVNASSEDMTEEEEADVEASVREALRLLEDSGDGESEGEQEGEEWRRGRVEEGGYLDFVHEVMEDRWTLEDKDGGQCGHWGTLEGQVDSEEEEIEEENGYEERVQKDINETGYEDNEEDTEKEHVQEEEWQEAFTAKGRVYYYNRRTRESSWKKPIQFNPNSSQIQSTAAATQEEAKLHHSVLRQSLGYHPSASASAVLNMERQTTLFCSFCGKQQPSEQLAAHFQECATAKFHKQRLSPLYLSFERALGLMSEDTTLRSVHYASSFPDPTPHGRPDAASMQDSLLLLRPRRRRSSATKLSPTENTPQRQHSADTTGDGSKEAPDRRANHKVDPSSIRQVPESRIAKPKKKSDIKKKNSQSTNSVFVEGPATQRTETCRYCNRSFAEGRLAKHEAVCPRVFGNEGSWGRGTPSSQVCPPNPKNSRVETPPRSGGSVTSNGHKLKDHTLQQSYKEHQATLVLCPCCRRKFAPSGAQQHIAICKGVQNRPKNPIPLLRDYAIAG